MGTFFYRAHRPAWAFAPLSGEGAAINGGRWNAVGQKALYLAADPATALAEYNQDLLFRPATIVRYEISGARLVNTRDPLDRARHEIPNDIHLVEWLRIAAEGVEPPTWSIARRLQADGYHGLLYASRINGGECLVLWHWNEGDGCAVSVEDPDNGLPRDNASWTPSPQ